MIIHDNRNVATWRSFMASIMIMHVRHQCKSLLCTVLTLCTVLKTSLPLFAQLSSFSLLHVVIFRSDPILGFCYPFRNTHWKYAFCLGFITFIVLLQGLHCLKLICFNCKWIPRVRCLWYIHCSIFLTLRIPFLAHPSIDPGPHIYSFNFFCAISIQSYATKCGYST